MVVRPHIRELPHLDQVPVIEIETAAGHPERLPGDREGRGGGRMNQLGRSRVDTGAALAPATCLASLEKSINREIALGYRPHRGRCPQSPDGSHSSQQQTSPPGSTQSSISFLHRRSSLTFVRSQNLLCRGGRVERSTNAYALTFADRNPTR